MKKKGELGAQKTIGQRTLTVEPFGVILDGALERMHLITGGGVEEIGAKNDSVRLGEFGYRTTVQARQIARVALF